MSGFGGRVTGRRGFLGLGLAGAVAAQVKTAEKPRVVVARDPQLRPQGGAIDSARLLKVLDRAMQSVWNSDTPIEAWKQVARPGQTVGVKVNCLAGKGRCSIRRPTRTTVTVVPERH